MRTCIKCGKEFHKRQCHHCHLEYRIKNADKIREYQRQYAKNNPGKSAEAAKKKMALIMSDPVAHEEMLRKRREWRKKNPESKKRENKLYKSRKRATGSLSKDILDSLYKLQKGKCTCCGKSLGTSYHLDHIMPISLGGKNEDSNMQLLTATCNLQKKAKHPVDFMQQRGFLL